MIAAGSGGGAHLCLCRAHVPAGEASLSTRCPRLSSAFLPLQVLTAEGWTGVMDALTDISSPLLVLVYFIILIVFGTFFLLNYFLAECCMAFNQQMTKTVMSPRAKAKIARVVRPEGPITKWIATSCPPVAALRLRARHWIRDGGALGSFIMMCIWVNAAALAAEHHPMDADFGRVLHTANQVLSASLVLLRPPLYSLPCNPPSSLVILPPP